MKSKTRRNADAPLNGATPTMTVGEILPNDAVIELVVASSGGRQNLLLWSGGRATVAPQVEYEGRIYEPPIIHPSILGAMRLPGGCAPYTSSKELLVSISHLFMELLGLPSQDSTLLAHFSLSTWFVDFLPSAPGLVVSGADVHRAMDLLRILSCVCRRSLMLGELTPPGFRNLPMHLRPTLLINEPRLTPRMATLLRSSSHRGLYVSGRRGEIIDLYGARAVFGEFSDSETMVSSEAISLSLPPASVHRPILGEDRLDQIARKLQSRLLTYRLTNWRKVRASNFDVPTFTFPTRALVGNLGACVVDDPESVRHLPLLLQSQDEDVRLRRSTDIRWVIIQVLLLLLHTREVEVRVEKLSALTNALLRSNGEILEYSPAEVGWKLRQLGLHRQRDGGGKSLSLRRDTSRRVHELGRSYGLLSPQILAKDCPDCASQRAVPSQLM